MEETTGTRTTDEDDRRQGHHINAPVMTPSISNLNGMELLSI